jgi:hypothetical protein
MEVFGNSDNCRIRLKVVRLAAKSTRFDYSLDPDAANGLISVFNGVMNCQTGWPNK